MTYTFSKQRILDSFKFQISAKNKFKIGTNKLNLLPNDKNLDQSKLKATADEKQKLIQMAKIVMDKTENIVGKEENAGYQHFLVFPQCVQKAFSLGSLKVGIVW